MIKTKRFLIPIISLWLFLLNSNIFAFNTQLPSMYDYNYDSGVCYHNPDSPGKYWPCEMNGWDAPTTDEQIRNYYPTVGWRFKLLSQYLRPWPSQVRNWFMVDGGAVHFPVGIKSFKAGWRWLFVSMLSYYGGDNHFLLNTFNDTPKVEEYIHNMWLLYPDRSKTTSKLLTDDETKFLKYIITAKYISVDWWSESASWWPSVPWSWNTNFTYGGWGAGWGDSFMDFAVNKVAMYPLTKFYNLGRDMTGGSSAISLPMYWAISAKAWEIWEKLYSIPCDNPNPKWHQTCYTYWQANLIMYKTGGIVSAKELNTKRDKVWPQGINMRFLIGAVMYTPPGDKEKLFGTMMHGAKKMKCLIFKWQPKYYYSFTTAASWGTPCNNQEIKESLAWRKFNNEEGNFFSNKYDIMMNFLTDVGLLTDQSPWDWARNPDGTLWGKWKNLWTSLNHIYRDLDAWCRRDTSTWTHVCLKLVNSFYAKTQEKEELINKYHIPNFEKMVINSWFKSDAHESILSGEILFEGTSRSEWHFLGDHTYEPYKNSWFEPFYWDQAYHDSSNPSRQISSRGYTMSWLASPLNNLENSEVFHALGKYLYYGKELEAPAVNGFGLFSGKEKWKQFLESSDVSDCRADWTKIQCNLNKDAKSADLFVANGKKWPQKVRLLITDKSGKQIAGTAITELNTDLQTMYEKISSTVRDPSLVRISAGYGFFPYKAKQDTIFTAVYDTIKYAWNLPEWWKDINSFKSNFSVVIEYRLLNLVDRFLIVWWNGISWWGGWSSNLKLAFNGIGVIINMNLRWPGDYSLVNREFLHWSNNTFVLPWLSYDKVHNYDDLVNKPIMFLSQFIINNTPKWKTYSTVIFLNKTTWQNYVTRTEHNPHSSLWLRLWKLYFKDQEFNFSDKPSWFLMAINPSALTTKFWDIFSTTWWKVKVNKGDRLQIIMDQEIVYNYVYGQGDDPSTWWEPPSIDSIQPPSVTFSSPSWVYWYPWKLKDYDADDYWGIMDAVDNGEIDFDEYWIPRFKPLVTVKLSWNEAWFGKAMNKEYGCSDDWDSAYCTLKQLDQGGFRSQFGMTPYARLCVAADSEVYCDETKELSSVISSSWHSLSDAELEGLKWYYFGWDIWPDAKTVGRVSWNLDKLLKKLPPKFNNKKIAVGIEFFVEWWGYESDPDNQDYPWPWVLRSEQFSDYSSWALARWFLKPICEVSFVWPKYTNADKPYSVLQWTMPEGAIKRWNFYVTDVNNRRISSGSNNQETGWSFSVNGTQLFVPKDYPWEVIYPLTVHSTFYFDRKECRNSSQKIIPDVIICPADFKVNHVNVEKGDKANEYILHIFTSITGEVCWPWVIKKIDILRPLESDWAKIIEKETDTIDSEEYTTVNKWKIKDEDKLVPLKKEGDIPEKHLKNVKNLLQSIQNPRGIISPERCDYKINGEFTCKVELNYDTLNFINHNIDLDNTQLNLPVNVNVQWLKRIFD